jgi:hypothetical protein
MYLPRVAKYPGKSPEIRKSQLLQRASRSDSERWVFFEVAAACATYVFLVGNVFLRWLHQLEKERGELGGQVSQEIWSCR